VGKRILIVDDEINIARIIQYNLDVAGYEAEVAKDGETALVLARGAPAPDLIILDLLMPKMDGWQVAQALKGDASTARIPILMLSIVSDRDTGLERGAAAYLIKPFSITELLAEVGGLLGTSARG